jgi:hypothetical protein
MHPEHFRTVDAEILEQHREIRARLRGLQMCAERVALPRYLRALRAALLRFAVCFDAHLAYEERELAPRVRGVDAWGPAREAALLAEHREQRRCLERVCALAEEPSVARAELGEETIALVARLLEDMIREEETLLELARLEELALVERMTG